jgi:hypothetical protein
MLLKCTKERLNAYEGEFSSMKLHELESGEVTPEYVLS